CMISLAAARRYAPRMVSAADDDAALARRIINCAPARDVDAEAELCRRLGPRIRLYGLRHLRDHAAASDLMQDVLVMLLQKLRGGTIRDAERVASFALGSARQRAIDMRRSSRRRERILEAFPVDLLPQDEAAQEPLDTQRLGRCLGTLSERERAVLVMTFYDDRPADAVALELGLSAGNVRVIRHRGLERLRLCMETSGGTT
ncbi:MAG TPA: sigma-70 family RNA polymerase sigma factor, partial [Steroidobacteraceae bacterium]